jgi:hypothetical protein
MSKYASDYKFERVEDDDPRQCDRPGCKNIHVDGSLFCLCHGGCKAAERTAKNNLRNYRLSKFKERVGELSNSDEITSLRDEVGILRQIIEERINHCNDTTDLLLISVPLSDLIMKAQKLVESMDKLEYKMGKHLSKEKVINLAQTLIEIIGKYVDNPEVLDTIGEDFFTELEKSKI